MKRIIRLISFVLVVTLMIGTLNGCSNVKNKDAYLSKGEFMLLFVSEIGLDPSADTEVNLSLGKNNKFRDAAIALVEIGYLTEEEAESDLNKAVTKEFVANLCIDNLYFRETFNIELKDEDKLEDPQACKDAVGHGIVEAENGYFVAYEKMTYEDCQKAIDTMLHIDATSTFTGEAEMEVILKEGVTDITYAFDDSTLEIMDPSDPEFQTIIDGMETDQVENEETNSDDSEEIALLTDESFGISQSSSSSNSQTDKILVAAGNGKNYCTLDDAQEDDQIVIRVKRNSFENRNFKVGEYIIYGLLLNDVYNQQAIGNRTHTFCGEVMGINSTDYFYTYYTVRIASEEEVMASAKLNKYNSKNNNVKWNLDKLTSAAASAGVNLGEFKLTDSGFKLTVSEKASNTVDSWRDAKFDVDMEYTFEVKDIGLTVDGFGSVLSGNIKDAICRLDYTVVNTFDASTEMRYTPDDNRNGKFLNNLTRSRFTGANAAGAKEIKIARLYADIGYGFNVELYVYLTIEIDGSIKISVSNSYGRGFKVKNNKVTPIYDKSTKLSADINVNAEAGVHFDFSLRWVRKKSAPWADLDIEVGLGVNAASKVFMLNENHDTCTEIHNGYVSAEELKAMKEQADIDYCFNCRLYAYYEISGLNSDTKIGKVIRWFDEDFSLTKDDSIDIKTFHFEDGKSVTECTRNYEGQVDAEAKSNVVGETFELDDYKVVIPEYTCGLVRIIAYPQGKKFITRFGGINVYMVDDSVAMPFIIDDQIVVEARSVGSTELIIESRNKRYIQKCSITVTENNY